MDEKCEWMFRTHAPTIQCTNPALWKVCARHGKESSICTIHLGEVINQTYLHDPDVISVYRIGGKGG